MRKIKIIAHGVGKRKSYKNYGYRRIKYKTKSGKTIYYTYGTRTTTRSSELLVKNGKLTEYGKEVREAMVKKLGRPFEAKVDELLHKVKKGNDLKESTFMAQMENALEQADNKKLDDSKKLNNSRAKIRTFIYNMGGDVEQLASDLGITKEELLNEKNWEFISSEEAYFKMDGYKYEFYFKYEENEIRWQRKLV